MGVKITHLFEARTSELQGAQAFLTKADSLSCAEITTMVETLNGAIFQTAALIADSFFANEAKEAKEQRTMSKYFIGWLSL